MLEKARREAFLFGRGGIAENAGQKPHGSIQKRLRGDLPTGEDKIAKAYLFDPEMIQNALIHAFEPPAQKRDAITGRKLAHHRLIHRLAARREIDERHHAPRFGSGGGDRLFQHVGPQNHPRAATGGCVVDIVMPPLAKLAQVIGLELPKPLVQRLAGQALAQNTGEGAGKERDHLHLKSAGEGRGLFHEVARLERGRDRLAPVGFAGEGGVGHRALSSRRCPRADQRRSGQRQGRPSARRRW